MSTSEASKSAPASAANQHLPQAWITAWNAHDLEAILSHYDEAVELTSPTAAQLLGNPVITGKASLRAYFECGLQAYPNLHFELKDILWGEDTVVLYYINQKGTHTAEFMQLNAAGKVTRVVAHYSA